MRDAGHSDEAIRAFASAYERLAGGESGMLPTAELEPATDVPALDELPEADESGALDGLVVIKLNGGLGTTWACAARSRWWRRATGGRSWTSSSGRRWRCASGTASACRWC